MIKTRHDLLLDKLSPVLCSETFKGLDFSESEHVDLFIMGFILYLSQRRGLSLLATDEAIDQTAIERTDPNDEEAAELERIAGWIVNKCQESEMPP